MLLVSSFHLLVVVVVVVVVVSRGANPKGVPLRITSAALFLLSAKVMFLEETEDERRW
jgi:hypothetical protein